MKLNSYLGFDGNCEAAFKFYAECLGGQLQCMQRFGETPGAQHVPAEYRNRIMHASLAVDGQVLMGSDSLPEHPYEGVKGCHVAIVLKDPAEAERIFETLSKDGTVQMPLGETFWATRFGMAVDRFGVPWMVNCEKPMP